MRKLSCWFGEKTGPIWNLKESNIYRCFNVKLPYLAEFYLRLVVSLIVPSTTCHTGYKLLIVPTKTECFPKFKNPSFRTARFCWTNQWQTRNQFAWPLHSALRILVQREYNVYVCMYIYIFWDIPILGNLMFDQNMEAIRSFWFCLQVCLVQSRTAITAVNDCWFFETAAVPQRLQAEMKWAALAAATVALLSDGGAALKYAATGTWGIVRYGDIIVIVICISTFKCTRHNILHEYIPYIYIYILVFYIIMYIFMATSICTVHITYIYIYILVKL